MAAWSTPKLANDPQIAAFRTQLDRTAALPRVPEWENVATSIFEYGQLAARGKYGVREGAMQLGFHLTDTAAPGLRRRVRQEGAPAPAPVPAAEVVHGPARSAEDVRSSWSALAQGVQQARTENHHPDPETAQEGTAP